MHIKLQYVLNTRHHFKFVWTLYFYNLMVWTIDISNFDYMILSIYSFKDQSSYTRLQKYNDKK